MWTLAMAKQTGVLFGVENLVNSRNIVLDGVPIPQQGEEGLMQSLPNYFGHF